jgi:predicted O-methyltransferase YrrM
VLNDKRKYDCYEKIERVRNDLLAERSNIEVEDFGAGSSVIKTNKRAVYKMAASSLKPRKYSQMLFRIVHHYRPKNIIEIGTSFGITASYIAAGNPSGRVITLEGSPAIAAIAEKNFRNLQLNNIQLVQGDFEETLPRSLSTMGKVDMVFIDGNHRKEPTIDYFSQVLRNSHSSTLFILDDIHWSSGMEEAWNLVKQHPSITMTIDLFFLGIAFVSPDLKEKQHFQIRF